MLLELAVLDPPVELELEAILRPLLLVVPALLLRLCSWMEPDALLACAVASAMRSNVPSPAPLSCIRADMAFHRLSPWRMTPLGSCAPWYLSTWADMARTYSRKLKVKF